MKVRAKNIFKGQGRGQGLRGSGSALASEFMVYNTNVLG